MTNENILTSNCEFVVMLVLLFNHPYQQLGLMLTYY